MTGMQVIAPRADEHLFPAAQLTAGIFSGGQYVEAYAENYIGGSHYDWDTSRVVFDTDKMVHHWGVWGYQMRLPPALLNVAGVGAVATDEAYRRQGLMHRAARASFEAMARNGYDLSILHGQHYAGLGYARAWNYVTYRFKPEDLPDLKPGPYRPLGAEQVPQMDALYNRTHADFAGTAVRPTYRNRRQEDLGTYAWFDDRGGLEGYVRALPDPDAPKTLACLEAAGDPRRGLAVLADLGKREEYESLVCFNLPHLHPMLQELRRGDCIVEDRYFRVSGWRVRLVNLRSTLRNLVPLFEQRLAASQFASWQGSLFLDGGEQQATLHVDRGRVEIAGASDTEHALHGGADVARLLIGSDEPDEIVRQAGMRCEGTVRTLAGVLFPRLHPVLSYWDEM
jgi:hypothetical protein